VSAIAVQDMSSLAAIFCAGVAVLWWTDSGDAAAKVDPKTSTSTVRAMAMNSKLLALSSGMIYE
jgi:hypothetical protein